MATNYYLKLPDRIYNQPNRHIGKRVSLGRYNGCKFIWAMDSKSFIANIGVPIVDEYGTEFNWVTFADMIHKDEWEWEHVGMEFS